MQSRDKIPFNPVLFSQFKYGSKNVAREFGKELADGFLKSQLFDDFVEDMKTQQVVVLPSPYNFIPTATYALKDYLIANLNPTFIEMGMEPIQESKVFRTPTYVTDYGNMRLEERREAISSENFHADRDFLKGKFLIFLDDIKVTGSHQERMEEMIERLKLPELGCKHIFLYYAEAYGTDDPQLEDYLNYYAMKHLVDLDEIIKNDTFLFNTRNVKFILKANHEDCENFLIYQSKTFRETLYTYALGNGFYKHEAFAKNLNFLKKLISQ